MKCSAYLELVAAHADGALRGEERAAADYHRSACPRCARVCSASSWSRQVVARHIRVGVAPSILRERVAAMAIAAKRPARSRQVVQGALAALAMLALAQAATRPPTPMQLVADDVHAVARGELPPTVVDSTPPAPGLVARGWRIVASRQGIWGPMAGTMTVYEAADGVRLLLHEMESGPSFEMPPGGQPAGDRTEYAVDGVVVSVARRGTVISCLAGRMSRDEFHRRVVG